MKILHIIQRYPPSIGGSEIWSQRLCQHLSDIGNGVTVLTLKVFNEDEFWSDPPVDNCLLRFGSIEYDKNVKVLRCKRIKLKYYAAFTGLLNKVLGIFYGPHSLEMYFKIFKEGRKVDIVHLHTLPYPHNFIGYFIARLLGKKIVIIPYFHPGNRHYERKINYWLMKKCDAVFAISDYERNYLIDKGLDKEKVFTTYNTINPKEYHPKDLDNFKNRFLAKHGIKDDTKIVIYLGRKIEYKGIDNLIEAVESLRGDFDIRCFLVGPSFPWFDNLYAHLSVEQKKIIIDLGVLSHEDKVNLLHISDILVLPSKFEAFGIVFLEAWFCNIPVIGSDVGAVPEVIDKGGLTFKCGDSKDLALKIKSLLEDYGLAKEMAAFGRAKASNNYSQEKIGRKILKVYHALNNRKLKVLVVSNFFPPHFLGGAEIIAYEYAKELKSLGHEVRVFCGKINNRVRQYKVTKERNRFKITRINLHSQEFDAKNNKHPSDIVQRLFKEELLEYSPDIVHFHNLAGFPISLIDECCNLNIPTIMTLHDYRPICIKGTLLKDDGQICSEEGISCLSCEATFSLVERNRFFMKSLDKISHFICPSQYIANIFIGRGLAANRISVINNGLDLSRFNAKSQLRRKDGRTLKFGYVGYLGPHKGIDYLLRAFSLVKDNGRITLDLVVSGFDNDYFDSLKKLSKELKIQKNVKFISRIPHSKIRNAYKKLDALVLPSVWPENHPVAIAEAMALGLPVLASNIGGIPELVEHGINGLLSDPKDVQQLAKNMQSVISNRETMSTISKNNRKRIQGLSLKQQVKLMVEKYREIAGLINQ